MEHVYVFDYTNASMYHFTISEDENIEDVLKSKGVKPDDCYWMYTERPITIEEL